MPGLQGNKRTHWLGGTGWLALQPTCVPLAQEVLQRTPQRARTASGSAAPVESKATQPGLPRGSREETER
jgi:hypothetical protein